MTSPGCLVVGRAITKSYGARVALKGVSLGARSGEVLGFAGPNGSGKSTLGRILLGFTSPTSGDATIDGLASAEFRATHEVGFVPEETVRNWAGATVRELLWLREDPATTLENDEIVRLLGISEHLDRRIDVLSKGQWRIVICAFAMLGIPRVIVLDEPDAGLDPSVMARLREGVRHCATRGAAMLIFSHHLDEMALMTDRMFFLRGGLVVGEFARSEISPRSLRQLYAERVGAG